MVRLIDAEMLRKTIHENSYVLRDNFNTTDKGMFIQGIDYAIAKAPTIEVALAELVRYSKWDAVDEDEFHYRCFSCGFNAYGNTTEVMDGTFRYCPHCGARMEGTDEAD